MSGMLIKVWMAFGRLPFPIYRLLAGLFCGLLTLLLFVFARERRTVALTNLRLCFPKVSASARLWWVLQHIYFYLRTFLDRAWLWSGNAEIIRDRVVVLNPEALSGMDDQPTILLAPHFLGLDAAWSRLSLSLSMVTMYSNQKNPELNSLILAGRSQYGDQLLLSRQQGIRPLVSAMKKDRRPLYYLPDMDFGEKDSVFVTFFGQTAATVTAVGRLSRLMGARVLPVTTRFESGRYYVTVQPALAGFPLPDEEGSAQFINHQIELWVQANVPQYLWLHKRFKTQPEGAPRIY